MVLALIAEYPILQNQIGLGVWITECLMVSPKWMKTHLQLCFPTSTAIAENEHYFMYCSSASVCFCAHVSYYAAGVNVSCLGSLEKLFFGGFSMRILRL